jgi:hypothetical protein
MNDLKDAILNVLEQSDLQLWQDDRLVYIVPQHTMSILAAEYNIHFVEPEEEQLEL